MTTYNNVKFTKKIKQLPSQIKIGNHNLQRIIV